MDERIADRRRRNFLFGAGGLAFVVGIALGSPDKRYELNRIRVEPGDGAEGLAAKLAAAAGA